LNPLLILGAIVLFALSRRPIAQPVIQSAKAVVNSVKQGLQSIAALPVWSSASRAIFAKVASLIPDSLAAEAAEGQQARYDLLKTLPEEERAKFADFLFKSTGDAAPKSLAAVNALMGYISLGGTDAEEIEFWQGEMGMREPSGKLDYSTLVFMKKALETAAGKPLPIQSTAIFGVPVMREFGLLAPVSGSVGKRIMAIRGNHMYVRRQRSNKIEMIGSNVPRPSVRSKTLREFDFVGLV